jgi:hypothetical protein
MPPLRELNPSNSEPQDELLHDRMQELEIQNSQLQALVVDLLSKNEQLRLTVTQLAKEDQS